MDTINPLKSATIYRNGAFNYSYVCYHCLLSFTNISDILEHIETHFDDKGEIAKDEIEFIEVIPDTINDIIESPLLGSEVKLIKDEIISQRVVKTETIHSIDDLKDKLLACEVCEHNYDCEDDLNQHIKEIHIKEEHIKVIHQCELCYHLCSTTSLLLTHLIEVHVNTTKLSCSFCPANFHDKTLFEKHLINHLKTKVTSYGSLVEDLISKCEMSIKLEVEESALSPEDAELLECDICSLTYNTKSKLNLHMKRRHVPVAQQKIIRKRVYMCDLCNRKIQGKFLFYAHQYEHLTGGNRLNASDDIAVLDNLKTFLNDNLQYDESSPEPFGCKICGHLSVKRRKSIENHILQEHVYRIKCKTRNEKRYPCEYCGQKFALSHNMMVHMRTHTNEKPYQCSTCNKSFSHASYMKTHERVHSGIRDHQCSTCGLSFKSNKALNLHSKVHSTETAKCPICNKEFKSHRLDVHIRDVHQNEHRPYPCMVCKQQFKTAQTLRTHSYRHSGEKKFKCRFQCNERFTSTAGRRGHERSKHDAP